MRVWRICRQPFADLSGEGARRYGGRWNSPGRPVVYAAEAALLAVLEVRVHLDLSFDLLPSDYVLMEIETGTESVDDVPNGVSAPARGDYWLISGGAPLLRVPSVIVPETKNILINPRHPAARSISVVSIRPFRFDQRLWEIR